MTGQSARSEPRVVHRGVGATARQEFLGRAHLDDAAVVDDDDAVRALGRREAVRDEDRRTALEQSIEGALDDRLALQVE